MSALGRGLLEGFGGALAAKEQDYQQKKELNEKMSLEEWKIERQKEFTKWQLETTQKFEESNYFTDPQIAIREDKTQRALDLAEAGAMRTSDKLSEAARKSYEKKGLTFVAASAGIDVPEGLTGAKKESFIRRALKKEDPSILAVYDAYQASINESDYDPEAAEKFSMLQTAIQEAITGVPKGQETPEPSPEGLGQFYAE